jgi:hypothetical protein
MILTVTVQYLKLFVFENTRTNAICKPLNAGKPGLILIFNSRLGGGT